MIDALRMGGAEQLLVAMVRELARSSRVESAVCAFSAELAHPALLVELSRHAAAIELIPADPVYDPRLLRGVTRIARSFGADALQSHLPAANLNARAAGVLLRRPHVATVHTMPGRKSEDTQVRQLADGWSARLSARIVAPSREIAAAYGARFRLGERKLSVIPSAPATVAPDPALVPALREGLLAGRDGPLVVCVARLKPEKAIDELIRATAELVPAHPGLRVVVAGPGPEEARLRSLAAELGLGEAFALLGERSDIGAVLAAADAFCLPSRYEGLPLSVLEAMQAGLACVATNVGGIPDLIRDGENGLLAEPAAPALAAALGRLLTDPGLRARLGAAASAHVAATSSPAAVAGRYADLYEAVTSR